MKVNNISNRVVEIKTKNNPARKNMIKIPNVKKLIDKIEPSSRKSIHRLVSDKKAKKISTLRVFIVVTGSVLVVFLLYGLCDKSLEKGKAFINSLSSKTQTIQEDIKINNLKKTEQVNIQNVTLSQNDIVASLSRLVKLPDEPISMMVKVKDANLLRNQSVLYEGVEDGDYILIYPSYAYIYNADNNKLIKTISLK